MEVIKSFYYNLTVPSEKYYRVIYIFNVGIRLLRQEITFQ